MDKLRKYPWSPSAFISAAGMNYELYRRSILGLALTDALDELVQNQQLTPNLGLKVMGQFDKVMTEALNNKVKVRANLKVF
jgi:transcription initiation factor TFIIA small subunit